eukprot:COSAG01_NODE_7930_length_2987_cov_100.025277_3_plen_90_part_00
MGDGGCAEAHTTKTETKPSTEQAARPTEAPCPCRGFPAPMWLACRRPAVKVLAPSIDVRWRRERSLRLIRKMSMIYRLARPLDCSIEEK